MNPEAVVTIGLASLLIGAIMGGFGGAWWLSRVIGSVKVEMLTAVQDSRSEGDKHIEKVATAVERLSVGLGQQAQRLSDHQLEIEKRLKDYVSRDTFILVVNDVKSGAAKTHEAIAELVKQVSEHHVRTERGLAELRGLVSPGALLKEMERRMEGGDR